jgi:hypothetical protein
VQPANGAPASLWALIGYRVLGDHAIRFDCAERLAASIRKRAKDGAFAADSGLIALAGCEGAALAKVMDDLGYGVSKIDGKTVFTAKQSRRRPKRARRRNNPIDSPSPFAKLRDIAI